MYWRCERQTITATLNLHAQEVMKLTQVLHCKLLLKGSNGAAK